MNAGTTHPHRSRHDNPFSGLLVQTVLAGLVVGIATATLLTLGVFGLTMVTG